jgi:hypothetical protein
MKQRIILHLCADIGSDSKYYQLDPAYRVIKIGKDIGVENFSPHGDVHGIIANPVCTEFSTARGFHKPGDYEKGLEMVRHCMRIIEKAKPSWWVLENPATGQLAKFIGKPRATYQPWEYGSPWTKKTALWGDFKMPLPKHIRWHEVTKIDGLYQRPGRTKPALAFMHKSAVDLIPEMAWAKDLIHEDADLRSMCSDGFAKAFYYANP